MSALDEGDRLGISFDDDDEAAPVKSPTPAAVPVVPSAPERTSVLPTPPQASTPPPLPVEPEAAPVAPVPQRNVHAKRRGRAAVVIALALVGVVAWMSQSSDEVSLMPQGVTPEAAGVAAEVSPDAAAVLSEDLGRAAEHFAANGTFRGFAPTAPVTVATGDEAVVMVLSTPQGCFFTGIAPGFNSEVKSDPTGVNCDPASLATVQAELDGATSALSSASDASGQSRLETAVPIAQYWANHNYVDGTPSFSGLEGYTITDGVSVRSVNDGGASVTLVTALDSGGCSFATVTALDASFSSGAC